MQLPSSSRLATEQAPATVWTTEDYLLASVIDVLNVANWQRGGGKGSRPKPLHRPGRDDRRRMGKARPLHEVRELLDRWRTGQLRAVETDRSRVHHRRGVTHGR